MNPRTLSTRCLLPSGHAGECIVIRTRSAPLLGECRYAMDRPTDDGSGFCPDHGTDLVVNADGDTVPCPECDACRTCGGPVDDECRAGTCRRGV